mgnify:CR=1 FL=1|jgi:rRNA processing protein Gar1
MGIIVDSLSEDRDNIIIAQEKIPQRIVDATAERDSLATPAIATGQQVLDGIDVANSLKTQIAAIGGNTGLSSTRYGSSTSNISSQYGSIASGITTAFGADVGLVGVGTDVVVAYGRILQDQAKVYDYPNVTSGNYNTDLIFDGEGYVTMTGSNLGVGASTRVYKSTGSQIGLVFDITGPAVDVSSLISDYDSNWTTLEDKAVVATSVQEVKLDSELQIWGLNRQSQVNSDEISRLNTSIGIASNSAYGGPW